ncbi:MLO-like protein 1 [Linum perenne]
MREARGTARGTTERGERDGERDDRERRQGRPTGTTERGDRGGRERRPTGTISEDRLSQRMEKVMLLIIEKLIIMQVKWQLQRFIWTWRWSQQTHCKGNPQFNFHNWYLWKFVVIFLLLNVAGWHAYFCIAFVPFIFSITVKQLLLAVGTRLEHIITQLDNELLRTCLHLPSYILTVTKLQLQYKFDSCVMGKCLFIIPRLVIGVECLFLGTLTSMELVHL